MKKLILCEGQNDSIFLGKLFTELDIPQTKIFDQKIIDKLKQLRHADAVEIMREKGLSRLYILDENGFPEGILSTQL